MLRRMVAATALFGLTSTSHAQGKTEEHYWLNAREGADTTHVERVHRRTTIDGRTLLTSEIFVPSRARLVVSATTDNNGCVREAIVNVYPWQAVASGSPVQRVAVALKADSVLVEVSARGTSQRLARPVTGATSIVPTESDAVISLLADCARRVLSADGNGTLSALVFPNLRQETIAASLQDQRITLLSPSDSAELSLDGVGRVMAMSLARGRSHVSQAPIGAVSQGRFQSEDYSAPPGSGYTAHDVTVRADDGVMLRGTLTLPTLNSGPMPAVITISGSGQQNRDSFEPISDGWRPFREFAHSLSNRGIAVLRMDDRGVGESEGDYGSSTERETAADVSAALKVLREHPQIDAQRIGLLGHSEGARVAMLVAVRDAEVMAIALLGGASDTEEASLAQARRRAESLSDSPREVDSIVASVRVRIDSLRRTLDREVYRWEPSRIATGIRGSIGIFHGSTDTQVPSRQAGELGEIFSRAGSSDVTVWIFPNVNHLFVADVSGDFLTYGELPSARLDQTAKDAIVGWLRERLLRP